MDAYQFWDNLDKARGDTTTLKDLCRNLGIAYQRIADQRSDCRFPKLEDAYALSEALGVSIDFLITGKESRRLYSKEARLVDEDPDLRALVRAVSRDRSLLRLLSGIIQSTEKANIG